MQKKIENIFGNYCRVRIFGKTSAMHVFVVIFNIRRGLGPDWCLKHITVAFDDVPQDVEEWQLRDMAKADAERQLYNSADYPVYGNNWYFVDIEKS